MAQQRVIVVTGGNRGIGLEICRQLAQQKLTVILTSREQTEGQEAVKALNLPGIHHHVLDVSQPPHIHSIVDFLQKEFGRCDGLVNNAGIFLDNQETRLLETDINTVRKTMEVNVYGPLLLCQALVPLMRKNDYGRIVNMSSGLGRLGEMGGSYTAYRMSKTAINVITRVLSAELSGTNILVNSMCPGWVKTRMGGPNAPRSVEQGADTAVWLSCLPDGGPSGKLFLDRKEVSW